MSRDPIRAAVERRNEQSTAEPLRWRKPRRLENDAAAFLRWSLVHPSACGRVLLEAGAPMTDGSTAYLVWLRVDDAEVTTHERTEPDASRYWTKRYGGPLGRYEGRWYRHAYDDGGLRSARVTAAEVAHEAAL